GIPGIPGIPGSPVEGDGNGAEVGGGDGGVEIEDPAVEEPDTPAVTLAFDQNNPDLFTLGSNDTLGLMTEGTLPPGATLLVSAASGSTVIGAFTHTVDFDHEEIASAKLDLLPPGTVVVTAQVIAKGAVLASASQVLQVQYAAGQE